jgi:hypothetical protein
MERRGSGLTRIIESYPDKNLVSFYSDQHNFYAILKKIVIRGCGAFRRFKDKIILLGVEDDWYKFKDEALKKIAVEWCETNEIECISPNEKITVMNNL